MAQRSELHSRLKAIVDNVYFQPPSNVQMKYPCIVYNRSRISTEFAGDKPYLQFRGYTVTVIDPDPDSGIVDAVASLPKCSHNTHFVTENLNHDVFDIEH